MKSKTLNRSEIEELEILKNCNKTLLSEQARFLFVDPETGNELISERPPRAFPNGSISLIGNHDNRHYRFDVKITEIGSLEERLKDTIDIILGNKELE